MTAQTQTLGRAGVDIEAHYRVGRAWWENPKTHRTPEPRRLKQLQQFCIEATCGDQAKANALCKAIIWGNPPKADA